MVIIARESGKSEFESFWGISLAPNVLFLNANGVCPRINGDEIFSLHDASGNLVDGPTPKLAAGTSAQRIEPSAPASTLSSWEIAPANPGSSSPGSSRRQLESGAIFISEVSDAPGAGSFVFEFVELSID